MNIRTYGIMTFLFLFLTGCSDANDSSSEPVSDEDVSTAETSTEEPVDTSMEEPADTSMEEPAEVESAETPIPFGVTWEDLKFMWSHLQQEHQEFGLDQIVDTNVPEERPEFMALRYEGKMKEGFLIGADVSQQTGLVESAIVVARLTNAAAYDPVQEIETLSSVVTLAQIADPSITDEEMEQLILYDLGFDGQLLVDGQREAVLKGITYEAEFSGGVASLFISKE